MGNKLSFRTLLLRVQGYLLLPSLKVCSEFPRGNESLFSHFVVLLHHHPLEEGKSEMFVLCDKSRSYLKITFHHTPLYPLSFTKWIYEGRQKPILNPHCSKETLLRNGIMVFGNRLRLSLHFSTSRQHWDKNYTIFLLLWTMVWG